MTALKHEKCNSLHPIYLSTQYTYILLEETQRLNQQNESCSILGSSDGVPGLKLDTHLTQELSWATTYAGLKLCQLERKINGVGQVGRYKMRKELLCLLSQILIQKPWLDSKPV